jgi:Putative transposase
VIYGLLFQASADTLTTIAADPKRLGVKIGFTSVLHTWGSAMSHHPHVHMIVPGGGITRDGSKWISASEQFLLPAPVLSAMFRGKMLALLKTAHADGRLSFPGSIASLADTARFKAFLEPLYTTNWYVHAKRPFAGPEQVLAYLARYTHRVAISNKRLIKSDASGVTFTFKDYRITGPDRYKTMTLAPGEFMRRFLLHVLPKGFHRIRHYGLLASSRTKAATLERARELIAATAPVQQSASKPADADAPATTVAAPEKSAHPCPCCGAAMVIIETFEAGRTPRHQPRASAIAIRIDTS